MPEWYSTEWSVAAAWAQAVLTAVAVFLAAWLQDRSVKRQDAAVLKRAWASCVALLNSAALRLDRVVDVITDGDSSRAVVSGAVTSSLDVQLELLRSFPIESLQDPAAIGLYADVLVAYTDAIASVEAAIIVAEDENPRVSVSRLSEAAVMLEMSAAEIRGTAETMVKEARL